MKKLLLFLFVLISSFIFNIDVDSEDNSKLFDSPDEYSFYVINKEISYDDLIYLFLNNDVSLISVKLYDMDKYIRLEDGDIYRSLKSVNEKIVNELGRDDENIKYLLGKYSISSMKVYGKNKDIYSLIKDFS